MTQIISDTNHLRTIGFVLFATTTIFSILALSRQRKRKVSRPGLVGVIGGLGPKATAVWYDQNIVRARSDLHVAMDAAGPFPLEKLDSVRTVSTAEWTLDEVTKVWDERYNVSKFKDQDHVPLLIYSNPTISGRREFMCGLCDIDPTEELAETIQSLVDGGVTAICMICSTAHYFKSRMLKDFPDLQFFDMIEMTLDYAARVIPPLNMDGRKTVTIGLLGTDSLLQYGVFHEACTKKCAESDLNLQLVTPFSVTGGDQTNFNEAVFGPYGIKAGYDSDFSCPKTRSNFDRLMCEVTKLVRSGSQAIVLGCTELPLLLTEESLATYSDIGPLKLINPGEILGDEVIRYALTHRGTKIT